MTRGLLFLLLLVQPARTLPTPQEWDAAERAIVRLKPDAFKNLAPAVRTDLYRRQCSIPQPDGLDNAGPHNVITGRFMSQTSTDIAVLCSNDGLSATLVYRDAATTGHRALRR